MQILASGTLSPLVSFASELDIEFKHQLEAPHVIDTSKQVRVCALSNGARSTSLMATYGTSTTTSFIIVVSVYSALHDRYVGYMNSCMFLTMLFWFESKSWIIADLYLYYLSFDVPGSQRQWAPVPRLSRCLCAASHPIHSWGVLDVLPLVCIAVSSQLLTKLFFIFSSLRIMIVCHFF